MKVLAAILVTGSVLAVPALAETAREEVIIQERSTTQVAPAQPAAPGVIILEQQTAKDPFPHQGADNPSGVPGQQDFNNEDTAGGQQTIIDPGHPNTLENRAGQLDPQEAKPDAVIITK